MKSSSTEEDAAMWIKRVSAAARNQNRIRFRKRNDMRAAGLTLPWVFLTIRWR